MIEIRQAARAAYADVYAPEAIEAMKALAPLDNDRQAVMASRIDRRQARAASKQRITFLDPQATIAFPLPSIWRGAGADRPRHNPGPLKTAPHWSRDVS